MEISASASLTSSGLVPRLLPLLYPHAPTTSCKPLLSSSSSSIGLISSHRRIIIAPSLCLADQSAFTGVSVVDSDPIDTVKRKAMDISPALKGASIFLVGINNPIKANAGKLLAEALRYYYFDSDNLITEAAGGNLSAHALKEADEKAFQESETEVLKQLSSMGRLVVCAGDGAVQSLKNLSLLRHGISIWIDVPLDIAAKGDDDSFNSESSRELFDTLKASYEKSRKGYETADASISLDKIATKLEFEDLEAVTSEDIALEILKEIEKLTRVKKMMEEASRPF
ncbi:PREDICTED: probable inactive shikimate kinase like 1, chloroplastic [Camelina sativa]|uniref:Probable inactive shikimate kinase like 1, chloroplastic n=1 Tax=Camelina sativa TaxID=90675 RepID=A0ABM0ZDT7_CAMSA|nr:PREDICTED: probable inactive shikimate kinase like 1, chloroplastic [Camelina sativa]